VVRVVLRNGALVKVGKLLLEVVDVPGTTGTIDRVTTVHPAGGTVVKTKLIVLVGSMQKVATPPAKAELVQVNCEPAVNTPVMVPTGVSGLKVSDATPALLEYCPSPLNRLPPAMKN